MFKFQKLLQMNQLPSIKQIIMYYESAWEVAVSFVATFNIWGGKKYLKIRITTFKAELF